MQGKDTTDEQHSTDITSVPTTTTETDKINADKPISTKPAKITIAQKLRLFINSFVNFVYNPRRKTILGRTSLNWAKLATFYTVFYICLGCFFVGLLHIYALSLDRDEPRYYNKESTMAVRTTATVVGLGFRPQPLIDNNLIQVTDDRDQQGQMASSLRLYRDVYLMQKADAKIEKCNAEDSAQDLPDGVACAFNWNHIVKTENHPCSDTNLYGFKNEQPCVLVKLNKVYGWKPAIGAVPLHIQERRGFYSNKTELSADVYITCEGANPSDKDVKTDIVYYSLDKPTGSTKYGGIPNHFFPYRNAPDHVQPFVLVQFKNLPFDRLLTITCRAWAPHMEHDARAMRGMVNFQLYRTHTNMRLDDSHNYL